MNSRLSITATTAAILIGCWGVGVFADPVVEPASPPQGVELKILGAQRPEEPSEEPQETSPAPAVDHQPAQLKQDKGSFSPARVKVMLAGLWLRGMAVAASTQPPPIPAGVNTYPDQPRLDVSWSLQGLADEEDQGGEGDIVDYDG